MGAGESKLGAPPKGDIQMKMLEIYALKNSKWEEAAKKAMNIGTFVQTHRRGLEDALKRLPSETKDMLQRAAITELTAEASAMQNRLNMRRPNEKVLARGETPRNTLNRKLAAFYDAILRYKNNKRAALGVGALAAAQRPVVAPRDDALKFLQDTLDGAKKEWKKDRKYYWRRKLTEIGFELDDLDDTHSEIINILANGDRKSVV